MIIIMVTNYTVARQTDRTVGAKPTSRTATGFNHNPDHVLHPLVPML